MFRVDNGVATPLRRNLAEFGTLLRFDGDGNVFGQTYDSSASQYSLIRVAPNDARTTLATNAGFGGLTADGSHNLYTADANGNLLKITPESTQSVVVRTSGPNSPFPLVLNDVGNLFVLDNGGIDRYTPDGTKSTFATGISGPAEYFTADRAGNLIVPIGSGTTGNIYKFAPDGTRTTFATFADDAEAAAVDAAGNIYVTNDADSIYKFSPVGVQSTFATGLNSPEGLAFDAAGNLYVTDDGDGSRGAGSIVKIAPDGTKSLYAGDFYQPEAVGVDSEGNVYVADSGGISRVAPDGTRAVVTTIPSNALAFQPVFLAPGTVSPAFKPGAGPDSTVRAIVFQPDGRALIGGAFTSYRGMSRNGVARVNPDGGLDASFDPGAGADDTVNALLLLPNGQVLVGGDFSAFNGVPRNGVVRLNADGSVDPSFDAGLDAGGLNVPAAATAGNHPWAPDPVPRRMARGKGTNQPGFVAGLALDSANGKLLLAGLFQSSKGTATPALTRVLPAGGASDPGFDRTAGAPDGPVRAVSLQKDGKILVAGQFDRTGGVGCKNVARLNADGTPDPGFDPGAGAEGGAVDALLIQDDGSVVLGGEFIRAGGQPRARLARLAPNGTLDAGFDPGAGADGAVRALAPAPNGSVLVGGDFKTLDGAVAAALGRLQADGKADPTFTANAQGGANGTVAAIAIAPGGAALVGGDFSRVADSDRNRLALVDNSAAPTATGVTVSASADATTVSRSTGQVATVTFTRNGGDLAKKLKVAFTLGGALVNGVDYAALPTVKKIKSGQSSASVQIVPLPGGANGKVKLTVSAGSGYAVGNPAKVKVKITN